MGNIFYFFTLGQNFFDWRHRFPGELCGFVKNGCKNFQNHWADKGHVDAKAGQHEAGGKKLHHPVAHAHTVAENKKQRDNCEQKIHYSAKKAAAPPAGSAEQVIDKPQHRPQRHSEQKLGYLMTYRNFHPT